MQIDTTTTYALTASALHCTANTGKHATNQHNAALATSNHTESPSKAGAAVAN
jgi:hypothetical protein